MLSHQKNQKFRLAQKLVGLTTLVLLAVSFGQTPAAVGQKSAAEVAKSEVAAQLEPAKIALKTVVATYFKEYLYGATTKKFFEGWTDANWMSLLQKTPKFYVGASFLQAGDPELVQSQEDLKNKFSDQLVGAIAETFHWVRWRKKIQEIAKVENYTDVEFIDEESLSVMFPQNRNKTNRGKKCDGLAIAWNNGNPPERVILGVFESKTEADKVKPEQIEEFMVRVKDYYKDGKDDVSRIRLNDGKTKLLQTIDDSDTKNIIAGVKEFHKETAQFLTDNDSLQSFFRAVSSDFADKVMRQTLKQREKYLDLSLPIKALVDFINEHARLPRLGENAEHHERRLAIWINNNFDEYEKEIKAVLLSRGGIDEARLDWALKVRAEPWKKELPKLAKFILDKKRFPNLGKGASKDEMALVSWLNNHFNDEKKKLEILDYLRGRGGVDHAVLDWALEVKANPWKKLLPTLAKFIKTLRRFPNLGKYASEEERTLANWVRSHFRSEKKTPEIFAYLTGRGGVDEATLNYSLEDFEKKKRGSSKTKIPATDANPGLRNCTEDELKDIIRELDTEARKRRTRPAPEQEAANRF